MPLPLVLFIHIISIISGNELHMMRIHNVLNHIHEPKLVLGVTLEFAVVASCKKLEDFRDSAPTCYTGINMSIIPTTMKINTMTPNTFPIFGFFSCIFNIYEFRMANGKNVAQTHIQITFGH
jgi:hypothetical protein